MSITEIRNAIMKQASISAIIQGYGITINQNKCICPFHDDNKPSMSIMKNDEAVKCFTCGAKGNAYNFVSQYEEKINNVKLNPNEIFIKIAEKANLNIDVAPLSQTDNNYQYRANGKLYTNNEIQLLKTMTGVNEVFQLYLNTKEGKEAKKYLLERGITEEIQKDFALGYSPIGTVKSIENKSENFSTSNLIDTNILSIGDNGRMFETFRDRITIPIKDDKGNIVGFGGRIINDNGKTVKYLNTKETDIFHKSSLLFNYDNAKRVSYQGELYIVEGYMDAISSIAMGIKNVVGIMGVELSESQINMIKRLNCTVNLALDNDNAGHNATIKNVAKLNDAGIRTNIIDISKLGNYKDFGDLAEAKKTELDIEKAKTSAFSFILDKSFFRHQEMTIDVIKNVFDTAKREALIEDTKDELEFKEFVSHRTEYTKEELEKVINPTLLEENKTPLQRYKDNALVKVLNNDIEKFISNYSDKVLIDYYNLHKEQLFNEMFDNLTKDDKRYFNTDYTNINVALMLADVTEYNNDYKRYETINRFRHDKAFANCFIVNKEKRLKDPIILDDIQKNMVIKQYEETISEKAKLRMVNVEEIFIINDISDLLMALPNNNLLPKEIKEQMVQSMREQKEMEFLSYAVVFPKEQLPYIANDYKTADGKDYKTVLFVNNLDGKFNITEKNYNLSITEDDFQTEKNEFVEKEEIEDYKNERKEFVFTIDKETLLQAEYEESYFVRIPNTQGKLYMYLDKSRCKEISDETLEYVIYDNEKIEVFSKQQKTMKSKTFKEIQNYWDDKTKKTQLNFNKNKPQFKSDGTSSTQIKKGQSQIKEGVSDTKKTLPLQKTNLIASEKKVGGTSSTKQLSIPNYHIDKETTRGFYISTKQSNYYLYIPKKLCEWADNEKTQITVTPKLTGRISLYQKDKNEEYQIVKGNIPIKTIERDYLGTITMDKTSFMRMSFERADIKKSGDFILIPIVDGNKIGHVPINKRHFTIDTTNKDNLLLNYKSYYTYNKYINKEKKSIDADTVQKLYRDYKEIKISKKVKEDIEKEEL